MRSLKRDLAWWTSLGAIALSVAAGLMIYYLTASFLTAQFDASLSRKARVLASSIEYEDDEFELGFRELDSSEFMSAQTGGYLQVYLADGRSLYRSPSLAGHDLPAEPHSDDFSTIIRITLPDGNRGRCVISRVKPIVEWRSPIEPEPVILCVARDEGELHQPLLVLRLVLFGVGVFFAVGITVLTYLSVGRGLRPVDELAKRVAGVDEHALGQSINLPDLPRELTPILEQFNELLSRINLAFERERRFSSNVAHELRTPLSGLRTIIDVAITQPRSPEQYQSYLKNLQQVAVQLQTLTEGLLDLTRLERGLVSPKMEPVDINQLTQLTWQTLVHEPPDKQYDARFDLALGRTITTDPALLTIVLRNILHNALAYVNDGGVITIGSRINDSHAEVTVTNTGSHINAEDLKKVFDRFWRADVARSQTGEHFGLGLPLARQIINTLDGQITAESREDGVFVVVFTLPC